MNTTSDKTTIIICYILCFCIAFLVGLVNAQLSSPYIEVVQVNSTAWNVSGVYFATTEYSVETPTKPNLQSDIITIYNVETPTKPNIQSNIITIYSTEVPTKPNLQSNIITTYEITVCYGGTFNINSTRVTNVILEPNIVGANKTFTLNVTIWSPYGADHVSKVYVNFSDVSIIYENGIISEVDPYDRIEIVNYTIIKNNAWLTLLIDIKPHWNIGGYLTFDIYANDTTNNYLDEKTYTDFIKIINVTDIQDLSISSTVLYPNQTGYITGYVVYNGTSVRTYDKVLINGTEVVTDENGFFNYTFTAPSESGTYVLVVKPLHGVKEYVIQFQVSTRQIKIFLTDTHNNTANIPKHLTVEVYNVTTNELIKTGTFDENITIPVEVSGTYRVRIKLFGIVIYDDNITLTDFEVTKYLDVMYDIIDYKGMKRYLYSNGTISEFYYDNSTRCLIIKLNSSGICRVIYYPQGVPTYVYSNTTMNIIENNSTVVVVDVHAPCEIRFIDPRKVKVSVVNPYNISFPLEIQILNYTDYVTLSNSSEAIIVAQENVPIIVKFRNISKKIYIDLLSDMNITITIPYFKCIDYRNLVKEIYSNQSLIINDVSYANFNYSRVRLLVGGNTGEKFVVVINFTTLPTRIHIIANSTITYELRDTVLYIYGSFASSVEIVVEEQYKLMILFLDKLNNTISSRVYINDTKYEGSNVTVYLSPATYKLSFTQFNDNGFKIANSTVVYIKINGSDKVLYVYYKVPIKFEKVEIKKIRETNATVTMTISGYLLDYYNNSVPNKSVYITITNLGTGASTTFNTTTDISGYFTMTVKLIKGYNYKVEISTSEDDIYVLSKAYTTSISLKEITVPVKKILPSELLLLIIGVITAIIIVVIIATKKIKKTLTFKPRKYVKIKK